LTVNSTIVAADIVAMDSPLPLKNVMRQMEKLPKARKKGRN
jgi:predicted nuclease with RNAse H fold